MSSTWSTDEFSAAVEVEEFKLAFTEQIKSNLREILKDEIRHILKKDLKVIKKVSSTVSLLYKHVNTSREVLWHSKKDVKTLSICSNAMNNTVEGPVCV